MFFCFSVFSQFLFCYFNHLHILVHGFIMFIQSMLRYYVYHDVLASWVNSSLLIWASACWFICSVKSRRIVLKWKNKLSLSTKPYSVIYPLLPAHGKGIVQDKSTAITNAECRFIASFNIHNCRKKMFILTMIGGNVNFQY